MSFWSSRRPFDRLNDGLVSAFAAASNFDDARDRFDTLSDAVSKLQPGHVEIIVTAFKTNDQLHNSIYLNNNRERLKRYLERATGLKFDISHDRIEEIEPSTFDDDIPF